MFLVYTYTPVGDNLFYVYINIALQGTDQVSNRHHSVPDDTDNLCSATGKSFFKDKNKNAS